MPSNKKNKCCCPPADQSTDLRPVEGKVADRELAELCKAVGHPVRVRILRILARNESCICGEIVENLPRAQSTVSQHLKILKESGLIRGDIEGTATCYCLEPKVVRRLKALVAAL